MARKQRAKANLKRGASIPAKSQESHSEAAPSIPSYFESYLTKAGKVFDRLISDESTSHKPWENYSKTDDVDLTAVPFLLEAWGRDYVVEMTGCGGWI